MQAKAGGPDRMKADYEHVQSGVLHLLLAAPAVILAGAALEAAGEPAARWILAGAALLMAALAPCFAHLRVRGGPDALDVAFGPWPLFHRRVPYGDVVTVRTARSALIDGWGIHHLPGRGWTWNIHGRGCVELELRGGGRLRVGSDEPARLAEFLAHRVPQASRPGPRGDGRADSGSGGQHG